MQPEHTALTRHAAIEIKIGNVGLVPKLDALGAALAAVREAHRDGMPAACWAALHRAQEAIAEAIMTANARPALSLSERSIALNAAGAESGLNPTHNSPAPTHGAGHRAA